ncbi:hypothetical protein EVAR_70761_1 [Eumeta japonica]|uniref:Uncharacterized protein n=1 Tax=Eumeta variegata TaxID=151549 RepID=A0A4C1SEN2_EUMVA|nr:hypothetical protein EVAR_70761_1 [Eumeta japonica]
MPNVGPDEFDLPLAPTGVRERRRAGVVAGGALTQSVCKASPGLGSHFRGRARRPLTAAPVDACRSAVSRRCSLLSDVPKCNSVSGMWLHVRNATRTVCQNCFYAA